MSQLEHTRSILDDVYRERERAVAEEGFDAYHDSHC